MVRLRSKPCPAGSPIGGPLRERGGNVHDRRCWARSTGRHRSGPTAPRQASVGAKTRSATHGHSEGAGPLRTTPRDAGHWPASPPSVGAAFGGAGGRHSQNRSQMPECHERCSRFRCTSRPGSLHGGNDPRPQRRRVRRPPGLGAGQGHPPEPSPRRLGAGRGPLLRGEEPADLGQGGVRGHAAGPRSHHQGQGGVVGHVRVGRQGHRQAGAPDREAQEPPAGQDPPAAADR